MNNTRGHQKLVDDILFAIGSDRRARVWITVNGTFRTMGANPRLVKVGLPGACDITGIRCDGRRIEIEVKTGSGRLSPAQKNWRDMILASGGIWVEARSVKDAVDAVFSGL